MVPGRPPSPLAVRQRKRALSSDIRLRPSIPGAVPMRGKTVGVRRPGRDYAMIAAIGAIFLSVAVLLGITYRYVGRPEPSQDLAARMSSPIGRQPSEL
jgi:hypothetical protein